MEISDTISTAQVEIVLLGNFSIHIDGHLLSDTSINGKKARNFLKLLAHQPRHQILRQRVIEILWPELDTQAANAQFYKALHHMRKAFAVYGENTDRWIEVTDDIVRLSPLGGLSTDIDRFVESARLGLKNKKISKLERAFSIYRGDFLPMDRYEDWATFPREHYRQLYLDVLIALAAAYEEKGELSEAAEMFRLALDKDATLEAAHCGLMRIFAKNDQATRAFHQYEACREILRDELGMSPSSETMKTLNDVQEGKLSAKQELHIQRTSIYGPDAFMVGRAEACATLDLFVEDILKGEGRVTYLCGEAGMGKTKLVQYLIQHARQREISFYVGETEAVVEHMTYGPFIELFTNILSKNPGIEDLLPVELGCLIPGYNGKGLPFPHADKIAAKNYLFAQVLRIFSHLASEEPIVLVLEDLHHADPESKELLAYLMSHMQKLPLLFVLTFRKEQGSPLPEFIPKPNNNTELIELDSLSYEEHVNLLHHHADNAVIGTEIVSQIFRLAEGNPLYAVELLRHYMEKDFQNMRSEDPLGMSLSPDSVNIPSSIHGMVMQRLEKLSPAAHHLLYIAAVIGRQVPYELLASFWKNNENNEGAHGLFNALEEVLRARLLEERGLNYNFRHAIVWQTIYASISEARRRILHKQIVEQLLTFSPDSGEVQTELIAQHYLGAGKLLEAAGYLLETGRKAEKVYAYENVLQYYRQAIEILNVQNSNKALELKCTIYERTGDVYRVCGQIEKSYDPYEKAIKLAEGLALDFSDLTELHRKVAVAAILRADIDRSGEYLQKAFEMVPDDQRLQARLFITKALHLWHLNQLEEAYELAKKALRQAKEVEADAEASQACEILAMTCLPLGRWEEGLSYEMERKVYGWSPEIVVATDAHLCLWEYHVSGDEPMQKAHTFIDEVSSQATEIGNLRCVAVCHYALGTMHLWRGNRRHAVEELSSSLQLHKQVGSPAGMAYSLARKGVLHTMMGANELGWKAVEEGLAYARQASVRDHCLQRLYGVGIWNRIEAEDMEHADILVKDSETLLRETGACAACAMELYPWLAYYFLETKQLDKVQDCEIAVSELAEKTSNPIGKSIAAMIKSSLSVTAMDLQQAETYSSISYDVLKEAIPNTSSSPITHFLNRMVSQQTALLS